MNRSRPGYGAVAFAYDESAGRRSFVRLAPILDRVLLRHRRSPGTHLDLACGTGLASRFFMRRGFSSIGVDASLPMLRLSRTRLTGAVAGDLRAVPLRGTFGTITLLNDTVNALCSSSDLTRCFRAVRRLMDEDSLLLFDASTPATIARWADGEVKTRGRTHRLSIQASYSKARRVATLHFDGWACSAGRKHDIAESHRLRAWSRRDIVATLRKVSLRTVEVVHVTRYRKNEAWLFVVRAL